MSAKQYGDAWVYWPISCVTGALQAQPSGEAVNLLTCCDFTPDFKTFFDMRGALDAPEQIPSGGVRAQEFLPPGTPGRLLIAHVYRPGALEYRA